MEAVEGAAAITGEDVVGAVGRRREPQVDPHHCGRGPDRGSHSAVFARAVEQDADRIVVAAQARDNRRQQRPDRTRGGHGIRGRLHHQLSADDSPGLKARRVIRATTTIRDL